MKSVKIRMTAIGGLVALAVGAVLLVSATANVKNTLELLNRSAALTVTMVDRGVAQYVEPARSLIAHVRRIVSEGRVRVENEPELVTALVGSLAAAPQITGVGFFRPDGSGITVGRGPDGKIIVSPEESPRPQETVEFIENAQASKSIIWGKPFARDNQPLMTIGGAVYQDGQFVGVIGAGLTLVGMSAYLNAINTDESMTSFVLYGDDKVLAHPSLLKPDYRTLITPNRPLLGLSEIDDPVIRGFPDAKIEDLGSDSTFELRRLGGGGTADLILTRKIDAYGDVPWRVGVHVPSDSVGQQWRRLLGSIAVGLGLMIVGIAAALFLATRIARPIKAISIAAGLEGHRTPAAVAHSRTR